MLSEAKRLPRDFWYYFAGESVSAIGSAFAAFALPLLVYELTGSASSLGLSMAATFLPYPLFGLVIGALADRLDRKRMMIATDVLRAAVMGVLPLLYPFGTQRRYLLRTGCEPSSLKCALRTERGHKAGTAATPANAPAYWRLSTANSLIPRSGCRPAAGRRGQLPGVGRGPADGPGRVQHRTGHGPAWHGRAVGALMPRLFRIKVAPESVWSALLIRTPSAPSVVTFCGRAVSHSP